MINLRSRGAAISAALLATAGVGAAAGAGTYSLLADDGNTFRHVARVSALDANGNVVASFVARASGERMAVDRIADLP